MAERYTRVYTLESNQYQIDAPVIVTAGALLKDNTNNKVLAQLKFKSISDKIIKALKVSVQPLDVKGEQLGSVVEYQYLDLSAKRDEEFGQKAPIRLPDNNTRQFSVKILESLFEDSTEWIADSFESEIILEPESLADVLHNDSDLIEQFRLECGENNTVMPIFHAAYWICSCGAFNKNDETVCHTCYKEKTVLTKLNLEDLEEKKEIRLKNEAYDRAIAFAQEDTVDSLTKAVETMSGLSDWKDAEEKVKEFEIRIKDLTYEEAVSLSKQDTIDSLKKAQNIMAGLSGWKNADEEAANYGQRIESLKAKDKADKAAKKKKIIIAASVLCAIIAIVIVVTQFVIPNQKYNDAIALMETGKYEEAITAFEKLEGYKDSKDKIIECTYLHGIDLKDNKKYEEAIDIFESLGDYKDSAKLITESQKLIIKNAEVGDIIHFGSYNQDNDTSNGNEPIEWVVLDKEDNRILVVSKYGLDCKPFNSEYVESISWEACELRNWLNDTFYKNAFTEEEQTQIPISNVRADKNPKKDTDPGKDTQDHVFLLSIVEVEKYFSTETERQCSPTDYALAQGVYVPSYSNDCSWWLRTPGSADYNSVIYEDGEVANGAPCTLTDNAVRPAMWISIE